MSKVINGINIPNIPWEEAPEGYELPLWRYSKNPITKRNPIKNVERVFNSALVPFNGEFIGVFRCDGVDQVPHLRVGHSKDGYSIQLEEDVVHFLTLDGKKIPDAHWGYDPRVIKIEDEYYVVWCDDIADSPTLGIAKTKDFKTFYKYDAPFIPNNRNGVLFPRKINGKYYMLSRPSDTDHTPFGDIYLSESKDMEYWGKHRCIQKSHFSTWNNLKLGGGPAPIEIEEGWLVLIHGVNQTCSGYIYSAGAMILDRDDPSKILYRCQNVILGPSELYETTGFVPNVVFPTSVLVDQASGKMAIYYGCADTCTSIAFTTVDRLVNYIKENDSINK
ncbi:MAG: glycoside hydrolase family 130 protein [Bacilli bacterium]|nr:glycoside hydrolase family 130 protein [Bacilli bacterium]